MLLWNIGQNGLVSNNIQEHSTANVNVVHIIYENIHLLGFKFYYIARTYTDEKI
jgi:hypothetical protein